MSRSVRPVRRVRHIRFAALCGLALLARCAFAAQPDALQQLDQALKAVPAFQYGKDAAPLGVVEQIVVQAATDPAQRDQVEGRLLEVLGGAATRDAKEFICRQLFIIGTARSVPALEALLPDPELSHIARVALGRNEDPAAAEALRRAMAKTSGKLQAGMANSLGDRRSQRAVPDLQALLGSADLAVAQAAATALGKIGGPDALNALQSARANAQADLARRIDEALLLAADRLLASGQRAAAMPIYESFYRPAQPRNLRIAGLRGLVAAGGTRSLSALVESIKSPDAALRRAAIGFSRTADGQDVTRSLAELLPALPPEAQELLLGALAARNDPASAAAVMAVAENPGTAEAVRAAAYEALGAVGDASVIDMLVGAAATRAGLEQQAARTGLLQVSRGDVREALLRVLGSSEPKRQVEAIRAMAGRRTTGTEGQLLQLAAGADGAVRREALKALGVLAGKENLAAMLNLARVLEDPNDLLEFEGYILDWAVCGPFREKDKDAHALFDVVLPPERPDAKDVKWTPLTKGLGTWDVNLNTALGGGDDIAAYARTRVWSPADHEARLELGSDDGIKVWLNGSVVHANNTERGLAPRQDAVKVGLKQGWNQLLLKVTNRSGDWGFCCRLRQPDGAALEGLKVEAK